MKLVWGLRKGLLLWFLGVVAFPVKAVVECERSETGEAEILLGNKLPEIVNRINERVHGGLESIDLLGMDSTVWADSLQGMEAWQRRATHALSEWMGCSDAAFLSVTYFGREIEVLVTSVNPETVDEKADFIVERMLEAMLTFQRETVFPRLTYELAIQQLHPRFADGVSIGIEAGRTEGLIYIEIPSVVPVLNEGGSRHSGFLRMRVELAGWAEQDGSNQKIAVHRMEASVFQASSVSSVSDRSRDGAGLFLRAGTVRVETRAEEGRVGRSLRNVYRPSDSDLRVGVDLLEVLLGRSVAFNSRVQGFLQAGARLGLELAREGRERGARLSAGGGASVGLIVGGRFYLAVGGDWAHVLTAHTEGSLYGQVGVLTHDRIGLYSRVRYRVESSNENYPEGWSVTGGLNIRLQ